MRQVGMVTCNNATVVSYCHLLQEKLKPKLVHVFALVCVLRNHVNVNSQTLVRNPSTNGSKCGQNGLQFAKHHGSV